MVWLRLMLTRSVCSCLVITLDIMYSWSVLALDVHNIENLRQIFPECHPIPTPHTLPPQYQIQIKYDILLFLSKELLSVVYEYSNHTVSIVWYSKYSVLLTPSTVVYSYFDHVLFFYSNSLNLHTVHYK